MQSLGSAKLVTSRRLDESINVCRILYANLFERLLANSVESEKYNYEGSPCWEWVGYRLRRGGYGRIAMRIGPKPTKPQGFAAHRVMAEVVLDRPLDPDFETIEHACELTWCINPWHFKLATRAENTLDMNMRRHKRPRRIFVPLLDPKRYILDLFAPRVMPQLRAVATSEAPF